MNCDQSIDLLLRADPKDQRAAVDATDLASWHEAKEHARSCQRCRPVVELLRTSESALAAELSGVVALSPPEQVADVAYRRVRRSVLLMRTVWPTLAILAIAAAAAFGDSAAATVRDWLEPPPAVVTRTFSLECLSPEQAESLVRPYLPLPKNPRWQAEAFDVRPAAGGIRAISVRAPESTLERIPAILQRFEKDANAACRR